MLGPRGTSGERQKSKGARAAGGGRRGGAMAGPSPQCPHAAAVRRLATSKLYTRAMETCPGRRGGRGGRGGPARVGRQARLKGGHRHRKTNGLPAGLPLVPRAACCCGAGQGQRKQAAGGCAQEDTLLAALESRPPPPAPPLQLPPPDRRPFERPSPRPLPSPPALRPAPSAQQGPSTHLGGGQLVLDVLVLPLHHAQLLLAPRQLPLQQLLRGRRSGRRGGAGREGRRQRRGTWRQGQGSLPAARPSSRAAR